MASSPVFVVMISSILSVLVLSHLSSCDAHQKWKNLKNCKFDAIYNFGSSMSDTGNRIILTPGDAEARAPYGKSINNTRGRYSDGFIGIDYIAQAAGLPNLNPYLGLINVNDKHQGVNFAVGGATSMPAKTIESYHYHIFINTSLDVQLQWWDAYFQNNLCNGTQDCKEKLKSSLFIVGSIGPNDYYAALFKETPTEELQKIGYASNVVKHIEEGVRRLISYGAAQVLIPGYFGIGCTPVFVTIRSNHTDERDKYGCLKSYNGLIKHHNHLILQAILRLREENPNVRIVYGDYYNAMKRIIHHRKKFGFKTISAACCGTGGKYNFNNDHKCGEIGVSVCPDPEHYMFWDGLHLTQEAHKNMAIWFIEDILPQFECNASG